MSHMPLAWVIGSALDVSDYGAVGDGVADDTDAIQAAITAAGAGRVLMFPKGIYLVTGTLQISDVHTRWVGAVPGRGSNGGTELRKSGTGALVQIGTDDGLAWDNGAHD